MVPLTIVVSAYNRDDALHALFESMKSLVSPQPVKLVISVDNRGTEEVVKVANSFEWHLGEKEVVVHQEKLGLIKHFIWVGDQTEKYEHVLFLEDDMYVSPNMINYALQLIPFFEEDEVVAGASLYNVPYSLNYMPFDKIDDGYDNFFFQHPYWGNIWFKNKWRLFKDYLKSYKLNDEILPLRVRRWRSHSFKKIFIQYLIETGRTMVFPYRSMITNNSISGIHTAAALYAQTSFVSKLNPSIQYRFQAYKDANSRYDAFEEIEEAVLKRCNNSLKDYDFEIDTKMNKGSYQKPYVLTVIQTDNKIMSYASKMKPIELAAVLNVKGDGLCLVKSEDVHRTPSKIRRVISDRLLSYTSINKSMALHLILVLLKSIFKKGN